MHAIAGKMCRSDLAYKVKVHVQPLGDRDGRLLEMTRRRGPGRCYEVVRSALTLEKLKMLRYNIWSGRPTC